MLLRIQPPVQRIKLCQLRLAAREHGVERLVALRASTGAGTHTTASVTFMISSCLENIGCTHKGTRSALQPQCKQSVWFCLCSP